MTGFATRDEMDAWVLAKPSYYSIRLLIGRGQWYEAEAKTIDEAVELAKSAKANVRSQREPMIYAVRTAKGKAFGALWREQ